MRQMSITRNFNLLILFGLGLLALLPRVFGLSDFITTDEAYHWIDRTERFSAALASGRLAETLQTGHPGVTVMWLGSLGLLLERTFAVSPTDVIEHLSWLRLPSALLQSLCVPASYLLLRRLVAPAAALIAAFLWAGSPYLIAHSRVLHLDALLTICITLSILLLLIWNNEREQQASPLRRHRALIASGCCAGLALLTKGPALILLPFAGMLLLLLDQSHGKRTFQAWLAATIGRLPRVIGLYCIWLCIALLVVLLLWPALWADPGRALEQYIEEISSNGGRPNGDGQFFLGQAIADPGWLFYPIADLFRTTPVMLFGLLCIPLVFRPLRQAATAPHWSQERRTLLVLVGFICFWTLVMTLGPKKFDRYVLPTWPALLILAGVGLSHLYTILRARFQRFVPQLILLALCVFEISQPLLYHPYYLSYYNPILGGGAVAQRLFLIGWGEGMDQVGVYLSGRRDIGYGPVLSALGPTLQPFVPVDVRDVEELGTIPANYAVVYLESLQREANPAVYSTIAQTIPLERITIHGIDYALIYQLPKQYETAVGAQFGDTLHLRGVTIVHEPHRLVITPSWDVRLAPGADYRVFVHLLDAQGGRPAQIDVSPGGDDAPPTSAWQAGEQIAVPLPLELPADLPAGEYELVLGVYEQGSNNRLPLQGGTAASAYAGGQALLLERLTFPLSR